MSNFFQVVEKENYATDWQPVRYYDKALTRFDSEEKAFQAAVDYITDRNFNNAMTKEEKMAASEVFMQTEEGFLFGVLDGQNVYLTYPKNIPNRDDKTVIAHYKGDIVKDRKFFTLDGKAEVAVRRLPGT